MATFLATGYESVRIRIGIIIPDPNNNPNNNSNIYISDSPSPLVLARPWESVVYFEPTTLPHSLSNMSNRLCSKESIDASLVCCSELACLSASGRGGCCSDLSTLVCSCCTGSSSPLPSDSRCSSSVPSSCPIRVSLSPVSTGWVAVMSSVLPASLSTRSFETTVASSLIAIGGSSSGLVCRGSSVSFGRSSACHSSSLIVMGVVLPSPSCC